MIKLSKLFIVTALMCSYNFTVHSQTLDLIPITVGKHFEDFIGENFDMPDAKLVNIYTTPYITITKPSGGFYDYNFSTVGDSIGYATLWIATYYCHSTQEIISVTWFKPTAQDVYSVLFWNIPLLELFYGVEFSPEQAIDPSTEDFANFISKIDDVQTKMEESLIGIYVFGVGLPENIEQNGNKLDFNEGEAIFYFSFLVDLIPVEGIGNLGIFDICYQYFDSLDISCNYSSIRAISQLLNSKVFPNPTVSDFTVSFDLEKSCNMQILLCDILGQEVLQFYDGFASAGNFTRTFSTENLAKGIYFLKIQINGNSTVEKIIVE